MPASLQGCDDDDDDDDDDADADDDDDDDADVGGDDDSRDKLALYFLKWVLVLAASNKTLSARTTRDASRGCSFSRLDTAV